MSSMQTQETPFCQDGNLQAVREFFEEREREGGFGSNEAYLKEYKKDVWGDQLHPIKLGAWVISIDGETDRMGTLQHEKKAILGRYVKIQQKDFHWLKIVFCTNNGLFYQGTNRVLQNPVESPLSKKEFLVPMKGGLKLLDEGSILLVSRKGMFDQETGYAQAQKYLRELVGEQTRSDHFATKVQEMAIKLEASQEEKYHMELMVVNAREFARQMMMQKSILTKSKGTLEGLAKNFEVKLDISENTLEHARKQLQNEASTLQCMVSDLNMALEVANIEDSIRQIMSENPAVAQNYERRIIENWTREGILQDTEADMIKKKLENAEARLNARMEREDNENRSEHTSEGGFGDESSDIGVGEFDSESGLEQGEGETERTGRSQQVREKLSEAKDSAKQVVSKAGGSIKSALSKEEKPPEESIVETGADEEPAGEQDTE